MILISDFLLSRNSLNFITYNHLRIRGRRYFKDLKDKQSCMALMACHRMPKYTCETIAVPFCKLFNLSLQSHTYPKLWKLAHVMPIFKKGDKSLVSNYRTISLISCVGKSFERVIYKNVYSHLITNSLIHKYQSGFLPGHSTVHHLIELIHHACIALENHKINCHFL